MIISNIHIHSQYRYRIMVIDDDRDATGGMDRLLSCDDFDVVTVGGANVAVMLLESVSPDLIIVDSSGFPEVDFSNIRQIRECSSVPVIILSSHTMTPFIDEVVGCGADDLIHKPFDNRVLAARIRAKLRRSAM